MDDVELPPMPASTRKATYTPPRPSFLLTRKRTHADYDADLTTSSDPALFSSDDQAPGAENYVGTGKRKKHTFKGSWWDHQRIKNGNYNKREFKRNFDSGIFMGSEVSDEAPSSDSLGFEDELLRDQQREEDGQPYPALHVIDALQTTPRARTAHRPMVVHQSKEHELVYEEVRRALEQGSEDVTLTHMCLEDLPNEVASLKTLSKQAEIVQGMLETGTDLEARLRVFLGNNYLTQIPPPLLELTNLRVLSLRNNKLTSIAPKIRQLTQLHTLNIAGNKLTELPFEIIELAQFHKLHELLLDPNPWSPSYDHNRTEPVQVIEYKDRLIRIKHSTDPSLQNTTAQTDFAISNSPSLSELCLRHLAELNPNGQIDFKTFMPPNSPQTVLDRLDLVQTRSGQRCTRCGRSVVVPGYSWVEWWALNNISDGFTCRRYVPYRRVVCSSKCKGWLNKWCDVEEKEEQELEVESQTLR